MTIKKYKLTYCGRDCGEFDGFVFNAPNFDEAYKIFFGLSGMYGMPKESDYEMTEIGDSYEFDGAIDEWIEAVKMGDVE